MANAMKTGDRVRFVQCQYQRVDGVCAADIEVDVHSPTGYSHVQTTGWLHWASPVAYGPEAKGQDAVLKPCRFCGKKESENSAHIMRAGHRFEALMEVAGG